MSKAHTSVSFTCPNGVKAPRISDFKEEDIPEIDIKELEAFVHPFLADSVFPTNPKGKSFLLRKSRVQRGHFAPSMCRPEAPTNPSIPQLSALPKSSNWRWVIVKNVSRVGKTRNGVLMWQPSNLTRFLKSYFMTFRHKVPQHRKLIVGPKS